MKSTPAPQVEREIDHHALDGQWGMWVSTRVSTAQKQQFLLVILTQERGGSTSMSIE